MNKVFSKILEAKCREEDIDLLGESYPAVGELSDGTNVMNFRTVSNNQAVMIVLTNLLLGNTKPFFTEKNGWPADLPVPLITITEGVTPEGDLNAAKEILLRAVFISLAIFLIFCVLAFFYIRNTRKIKEHERLLMEARGDTTKGKATAIRVEAKGAGGGGNNRGAAYHDPA